MNSISNILSVPLHASRYAHQSCRDVYRVASHVLILHCGIRTDIGVSCGVRAETTRHLQRRLEARQTSSLQHVSAGRRLCRCPLHRLVQGGI